MYWIPRGWVPVYVEWMLSFPRAPWGSVSIQIWGIACATVVQLVGEALVGIWVVVVERMVERRKASEKKEGVKMKKEL